MLDFEAGEELQAVGFSSEQGKALVRIIANMQTAQLTTKARFDRNTGNFAV
jgi:hypothetical protein